MFFKHLFLLLDRFVSILLFLFYFQKVCPFFSPIMFYSVMLLAMSTLSDCRYWTWVDLDCEVDLIKSFLESAHISLKLPSVPWYVVRIYSSLSNKYVGWNNCIGWQFFVLPADLLHTYFFKIQYALTIET